MNSTDIITLHELSQDNSNTPSKRDVYSKLYAKLNSFHDEYFVIDFDESYGVDLRANFIDTLQLTEQGYNEFVKLATSNDVWGEFEQTERKYFEAMQIKGIRRKVDVEQSYPVSFNFWQVRFNTIDTIPGQETPLISKWLASIRMTFNFSRYEDKDLGLKNPYGTNIVTYNLSYLGNNIKSIRK
jgi:hypothetical protein